MMNAKTILTLACSGLFAATATAASTGVTINGIMLDDAVSTNDIGWAYESATSNLVLSGAGPFTLSGTNTEGAVRVVVPTDVTNEVTLSNLTLQAPWNVVTHYCPFALQSNAVVTLSLAGTNTLTATAYRAGLDVPIYAEITITNAPGDDAASLTAQGGAYGAGIGSSHRADAGKMVFCGGVVTATGGSDAAGVGGCGTDNRAESNGGRGGVVYIYGGTLAATGSGYSAGIGSGYRRALGVVRIWGGTVTAIAGNMGGPGIGGGAGDSQNSAMHGGKTYIYGGHVTATGSSYGGAGIGGGYNGPCDPITITGGTVLATGLGGAYDIGRGRDSKNPTYVPQFTGGSIRPGTSEVAPTPNNGSATVAYVVWSGFEPGEPVVFPAFGSGLPDYYGTHDIFADEAGCIYLWFPNARDKTYTLVANGCTNTVAIKDGVGSSGVTVNGVDAVFGPQGYNEGGWSNSSRDIRLFGTGPFVVSGANAASGVRLVGTANAMNTVVLSNLTLGAGGDSRSALLLESGANMTLVLEGTNTLWSGPKRAGIGVGAGRTLSINNAPGDDAATLVVTGGSGGAGIGGNRYLDGGTVTISGGRVLATAGTSGAGIGGGSDGSGGSVTISNATVIAMSDAGGAGIGGGVDGNNGGTVVIASGTVTATSRTGAGIGGGSGGSGGSTTIYGGTVTATSTGGGAGIGGGYDYGGTGGTITIIDGNVTATGGDGGAGIGGGYMGTGGAITISNGVVTATGDGGGAGVGSGAYSGDFEDGYTVTIAGGQLMAAGGAGGAGIGGGDRGAIGTVAISGGTVAATGDDGGAGIGGGSGPYNAGGTVNISGGKVTATGDNGGAGIGGGACFFYSGTTVTISGGTVAAQGSLEAQDIGSGHNEYGGGGVSSMEMTPGNQDDGPGTNTFTGGSVYLANDSIAPAPSNDTDPVWCVTVTNLVPHAAVTVTSLGTYGVNDLFADENGRLYLWLPDNVYSFTAGGSGYTAAVNGADATATLYLAAPVFAADGSALVFSGTTLSITIANAQSGFYYTLYGAPEPSGPWTPEQSVLVTADGNLVFESIDAAAPRRFFKVEASSDQP
ncbi:MAG: hypothetical protein ACOX7Q_00385 [Kiritimatiellia bacterium]|jgi:hypothetical protein